MTEGLAIPARVRVVLDMLVNAAERGDECPSNAVLATAMGASVGSATGAVSLLEVAGVISVERGRSTRVVTIAATGKRTAGTVRGLDRRVTGKRRQPSAAKQAYRQAMLERFADMLADGMTIAAISARMGITASAGSQWFAIIRRELGAQAA